MLSAAEEVVEEEEEVEEVEEEEEAEAVTPVGGVMSQKDVENQSGSRFSRRKEPAVCQSHQWCSAACHLTQWWPPVIKRLTCVEISASLPPRNRKRLN